MPARFRADTNFVAMLANGAPGNINNILFGISRPPREFPLNMPGGFSGNMATNAYGHPGEEGNDPIEEWEQPLKKRTRMLC